jgi:hypothetical protein
MVKISLHLIKLSNYLDENTLYHASDKIFNCFLKFSQEEIDNSLEEHTEEFQDTFWIPTDNISTLDQKIKKINKIVEKLKKTYPEENIDFASYVIEEEQKRKVPKDYGLDDAFQIDEWMSYVKVRVSGSVPRLGGWNFVARILHSTDDTGAAMNTILSVPGKDVSDKFRNVNQKCEHCNQNRARKDTFILHHPEKGYAQVGSSCLSDFIGHVSPQQMASYLTLIKDLSSDEGDFESEGASRGKRYTELAQLSGVAAFVVDKFGYVSQQTANERDMPSTKSIVYQLMTLTKEEKDNPKNKYIKAYLELTPEEREYYFNSGSEAVEWAKKLSEQEKVSDFDWNLASTAHNNFVDPRAFGIATYIPQAHRRYLDKERGIQEEAKIRAVNKPVNYVAGQKFAAPVKLTSVMPMQTNYGTTYLHFFVDPTGRTLVWYASNGAIAEPGSQLTIQGTVKDFKVYNGKEQVVITRIKKINDNDIDENYNLRK